MRRLLLALLFPLLLIAQQGAFVHELEHFAASVAGTKAPDEQAPNGQYCEKCFAFAHIGSAADVSIVQMVAVLGAIAVVELAPLRWTNAQPELARNRGPPALC